MLELLVKYAQDKGLDPEPGFKPKDVRWAIICDSSGNFLDVIELGDTGQKRNPGQRFNKCPDLSQGELVGGKETRSHFLIDTTEVVALVGKGETDQKLLAKHAFFIRLLREAGKTMPELALLAGSMEDQKVLEEIRSRLETQKAKSTDKVSFKTGEIYPLDSNLWHDWWRSYRTGLRESESKKREPKAKIGASTKKSQQLAEDFPLAMRCLVTGELAEPARTHPKIEGLSDVGGQGAGTTLIGFDKDSFCSYGFSQSANAAVSEQSASAYRAALNHLIKEHGQRLSGAKVVHWFKEEVPREDDPLAWLTDGEEQKELDAQRRARELLQSIQSGSRPQLARNYYYATTLSGAGGRVMMRDWMEGQFTELTENIHDWFEDLSIVHREGGVLARSHKLIAVLGSTVRDLDDLAAPFVARMWRVAVSNESVPHSALAQALLRARIGFTANELPNHARMGLLKAFHLRKNRVKGDKPMTQDVKAYLNEEHPNPAYHCGRLMAVLAGLQRAALGDVGAGVVQRYYAAASSTPALVLGRLTRTSQFHINKLEPGLAYWYENKLAGIWGRLRDAVPATLSLEDQSLFALGYYQQMADMRTKKSDDAVNHEEGSNE